jgi:hypothetical protein
MAPRNPKLIFLERALKALKKELPDATDAERLQAAQKLTDLEFEPATSRAARQTAESVKAKELSLQEQAAEEAKAKAERAANPQGFLEKIIGAPGSDRRKELRTVGITTGLTTGIGGLINAAGKVTEKSIDDSPPTPTTDGGKAPLTLKAAEAADLLNATQVFNQKLRGQAFRRYLIGDIKGAETLLGQQRDPTEVVEEFRASNRRDFNAATQRKKEERQQEIVGEQKLERIRQEAENKRKVLDLAGQVIQSTEGSMNIDLLPQRQY